MSRSNHDKGHHIYGPSSLDRLTRCVRFKYRRTKERDEAGNEGTELHEAFETGNLAGLTEEQAGAVTQIRNYVKGLKHEGGTTPKEWDDFREIKVNLGDLTYGSADCILFHEKTGVLHVIDAKFTRVAATHDMQLRTYAAAYMYDHRKWCNFSTVTTHVLAPRLNSIDTHTYPAELLYKETEAAIRELYARIDNPFTPPTPDEEVCGLCDRAAECPALNRVIVAAGHKLGLPLPDNFLPGGSMSPRDRAIAQLLRGIFKNWGDQIARNNAAFVDEGGEVLYHRLTKRSTGIKLPKENTSDAFDVLVKELGREQLLGCCTVVLGDVRKLLAKQRNIPAAAAKEVLRELLPGMLVEGQTMFLQKTGKISGETLLEGILNGDAGAPITKETPAQ